MSQAHARVQPGKAGKRSERRWHGADPHRGFAPSWRAGEHDGAVVVYHDDPERILHRLID
jgi:hypothetical protein